MKISSVNKIKNKYEVIINEEVLTIEIQTLINFNLHKNKELTKEKLLEIKKFNDRQIVYNKAIKYLATQKTTLEFKKYLFNLEVAPKLIYELVEEFTKKGYLNDDLFTSYYLKKYQKKYALKRIEMMLENKGISKELIDKYLSKENNKYFDNHLEEVINKSKKSTTYQTKQAILRKMVSLGYDLKEVELRLANLKLNIDEKSAIKKEYQKLLRRYQNKYEKFEINYKIKQALYKKGFSQDLIEKCLMEGEDDF